MKGKSFMRKTAFITGASGEIGAACAEELAALGFDLFLTYLSGKSSLDKTVNQITEKYGADVLTSRLDLTDTESIDSAFKSFQDNYGTPDLLVNNAACEETGLFGELSDDRLIYVMNADLIGTMLLTKRFLPDMIRRHSGHIINVSSVWGEVGASCETVYSAAKSGLIGFTKALAKECAPSGVYINCVSPGFIDTKMNASLTFGERQKIIDEIPCCRPGLPQDIARTVSFLTSGKADYICGQVIRIDGGWI